MFKKVLLTSLTCLILASCDKPVSEEIGYGKVENNVYTNEYFNVAITLPEDWSLQSKESTEELMKQGSEIIAGDNKTLKASIKASEKQSLPLFTLFKYEQGTPVEFNPSLICIAEKVKHQPGIKNGSDYFFHTTKLMQSSKMPYKFPEEYKTETISNQSFHIMPLTLDAGYIKLNQDFYACKIKDYIFSFILSYNNEEDKKSLLKIKDSIIFSK